MHMEVRWYRSEPSTPVFLYRDGDEVTEVQMEEYRGRVEWIEDTHPHVTTGKTITLTRWTFVGKVMSLIFNMLSR